MTKLELAKECIVSIFNVEKKEELYRFFTKDTVFFDIENEKNISLELMIEKINKFHDYSIRWLESNVSVKAVLQKNDSTCHIYFNIKRNRIIRLEFAEVI